MTRIAIVGDIHSSSVYGLAPPSSVPNDRMNAFLSWDYECWKDFCTKYRGPEYLILAGDLTDGSQVKILGTDALVTDTDLQVKMSVDLIKMLIKSGTKIYGVNGSGYHAGEGQATNMDKRVIEGLDGEYKGNLFEFEIGDEKIQVAHGGAGSTLINPLAYILREIRLSKEDAQKRKVKGPTILIRGHQHRSWMVKDDSGTWGVLNGCWQYVTPFMSKKSVNVTPSIGATIIDIEGKRAKIYSEEYAVPESVRQEMVGFEILKDQKTSRAEEARNIAVAKIIGKR